MLPARSHWAQAEQLRREVGPAPPRGKGAALIAGCLRDLGDGDSAWTEVDAARDVFERLGAEPDKRPVAAIAATQPSEAWHRCWTRPLGHQRATPGTVAGRRGGSRLARYPACP